MRRNLATLAGHEYDVLVIGGGIYGACVAWDATLRGLSVALVEKGDFGHATSANSLKTIHGGLRYLQRFDLQRMRESIRERTTLMRIAPHLVHPLPCVMPTYGHSLKGREAMALALKVNDLVSFDRNSLSDPQRYLPNGRVISRNECLRLLPGITDADLTGGALWYDCQMHSSERLTLAFVRSAVNSGADAANYVRVTGFRRDGDRIAGVEVTDELSDDRFDIRATMVINAAGPWVDRVLGLVDVERPSLRIRLAKAVNLVTRPLVESCAAAISIPKFPNAASGTAGQGERMLFVAPWRHRSLVGTTYVAYDGNPDDLRLEESDVDRLVVALNRSWPGVGLRRNDVTRVHCGLVPIDGVDRATGAVRRAGHYRIDDHRRNGLRGLISLMGVKYTTARDVAQKVVDRVFQVRGYRPPRSVSAITPLYGGDIDQFEAFLQKQVTARRFQLSENSIRRLVTNHGSAYERILTYVPGLTGLEDHLGISLDDRTVVAAEILHSIREEMAQRLADVVLRRTELGTAENPGDETIRFCANIMAAELNWSRAKTEAEVADVTGAFAIHSPPTEYAILA